MNTRATKDLLYQQVARIGKVVSSPRRLELIELLCQGEKSVEQLAGDANMTVKLASAHLKELKAARLVETQRRGKHIYYRLVDSGVADLWVMLRRLAGHRLLELQAALTTLTKRPDELLPVGSRQLLQQARRGDIIVIDVRPADEYAANHLPHARSLPLAELKRRLHELPADRPVVAYCRGPFCLMAHQAVALLTKHGYRAQRLEDGVAEWRARGLPLAA
ncbi:MAG: metalloregulator ArsR/SmtB family transcription factor [Gammaproteobacteria bacterium]|nr:metalloregulator ArsR/SmtB family transcription factor [Gammaproteobacteria bacterium]